MMSKNHEHILALMKHFEAETSTQTLAIFFIDMTDDASAADDHNLHTRHVDFHLKARIVCKLQDSGIQSQ